MKPERFKEVYESITATKPKADLFDYAVKNLFTTTKAIDLSLACYTVMSFCESMANGYSLNLRELSKKTLTEKAKEYAVNDDRLWNFKDNYAFTSASPIKNLLGYIRKQATSCMDVLTDRLQPTKALVQEKFGDVYNYCILLLAIIKEMDDDLCKGISPEGSSDEKDESTDNNDCKDCKDEGECNSERARLLAKLIMARLS